MRIAFLCKRQYMGKDVIGDRYGRLYEVPHQLARRGHHVLCLCLSYHGSVEVRSEHDASPGSLQWESRSLGPFPLPTLLTYPTSTLRRLLSFGPDLLIAASDIPHVALGAWLAHRLKVPYVADLYDNFEGFGQARIPGMKSLLKHSVRKAQLVTTTSEGLAQFVQNKYKAPGRVLPMPSTVDRSVFHPRDRKDSRASLGLPTGTRLIGTAGGLFRDRGIGALYEAWRELSAHIPHLHLVLAGPYSQELPPPAGPRVHYLGELPHTQIAELFCALDVGVIYLRETAFGRYCFPQKAYEMLACNLAVVATNVGAMGELFKDNSQCLYRADDPENLAERLRQQLESPCQPEMQIPDWSQIVKGLETQLQALVGGTT